MPLATQPTARPTNKALSMFAAFPALLPLVKPPVVEVWPQIAPAFLAGPAMTDAVAALIAGAGALALAWFVPDRANVER